MRALWPPSAERPPQQHKTDEWCRRAAAGAAELGCPVRAPAASITVRAAWPSRTSEPGWPVCAPGAAPQTIADLNRRRTTMRTANANPRRARLACQPLEDRSTPSGVDVVTGDPNDWPMYNHDPAGSRNDTAETRLSPATVGQLGIKWTF